MHRPVGKTGTRGARRRGTSTAYAGRDLAARLRAAQSDLRRVAEHRDALLDMVRAVNATVDPTRLADLLVARAVKWLPAPCWAVVTSDLSGRLTVLAERQSLPEFGLAVTAVTAWILQQGVEFVTADLSRDSRVSAPSSPLSTASVIALPLVSRGRSLGALIALDRAPSAREPRPTPGLLRAMSTLLEPAATALEHALLLRRAEALSVTDDLTQLHNSRYLNLVLRRETKRASRNGRPLSLLFIDLDGFKGINDAHGHLMGSRALVEAADLVRDSARETDVVARFGGDEFALVLPDTGGPGALFVGERIRRGVAAHSFLSAEGLNIRLTASVGVATLPDVASTPDELMRAADRAMYVVKETGKNGTQVAGPPTDT